MGGQAGGFLWQTVQDLDAMARVGNKLAASACSIDEASAQRAGLEAAVADLMEGRSVAPETAKSA